MSGFDDEVQAIMDAKRQAAEHMIGRICGGSLMIEPPCVFAELHKPTFHVVAALRGTVPDTLLTALREDGACNVDLAVDDSVVRLTAEYRHAIKEAAK